MHKFYYTYKITLLKGSLAGHYYYGKHRTCNLNDGYAGSGKIIRDYYDKYGRIEHQTYIKEIIALYDNDKELNEAEKLLIGDKFETDPLCLNLCGGGTGGNIGGWNKGIPMTDEAKEKISKSHKGITTWMKGKHHSEEARNKMSEGKMGNKNALGHNVSEESKMKMKPWLGYHWKKDPETGKRIYYKNIA